MTTLMRKMKQDNKGIINIDFTIAIVIFVLTFSFVFYALAGSTAPYKSAYNQVYPIANRATDILVKDPGWWEDETNNGTGWENHIADIERLGFAVEDGTHNQLSIHKLDAIMKAYGSTPYPPEFSYYAPDGAPFWELGEQVDATNYSKAKDALGIPAEFYMQIRPINDSALSGDNRNVADTNAANFPPNIGDVVKVERTAYVKGNASGKWAYVEYEGIVTGYKLMMWVW